jgi:uncharacterized membrane protein
MTKQDDVQLSEERRVNHNKLLFGGLIGISLIILQDFISSGALDLSALISVIAFAVAVPLLAMGILIDDITKPHQSINLSMDYNIVFFGGLGGAIVGAAAAFWHISWIAGIVFLVSGIFGLVIYNRYYMLSHKEDEESEHLQEASKPN